MKTKIEALGYTKFDKIKVDDNCYEIKGTNKDGKKVEVKFNPVDGKVVKEETEDDDDKKDARNNGNAMRRVALAAPRTMKGVAAERAHHIALFSHPAFWQAVEVNFDLLRRTRKSLMLTAMMC